jgi:hypothetical protein
MDAISAFFYGAVTTAAAWFTWWLWYRPRIIKRVAAEAVQITWDSVRLALYYSASGPTPAISNITELRQ